MTSAIAWQRAEGIAMFVAAIPLAAMTQPGWPLWVWPLALLAPDLSMTGYLAGPRIGAMIYNLFHLYAGGMGLALAGLLLGQPAVIAAGAFWLAHVGADRALGIGLKGTGGFYDHHLRVSRTGKSEDR
ncbi:DUF4260 domain-containing protein [Paracoccus sp. Z330]|uniref:DUF4260 domain-containing protein n=1 Tax=Paracoccus onchidii TaxID=3017813 RepID=A0ABT4Z9T2_9RHOB|nr:DUF4260 domain-containing protein [Paracoccus onchidii]MDB6176109.1 DUF4260 domain-containing protein [Paracoccus onchidii]